jgi:hypothetical protein
MKHSTTQALFDYWNDVRDGRPAPRRFDIEPSQIASILSNTVILERIDFETYRFRLAGTRVCEYFGQELRGFDLFPFWDDEGDRMTLEHHLSVITRQFKAGVFTFDADTQSGQTMSFEMLLLPLVHTRGQVDRCLGAIVKTDETVFDASEGTRVSGHRLKDSALLTPSPLKPAELVDERAVPFIPVYDEDVRSARIVRSERRQFRVYDGGLLTEKSHSE